MKDYTEKELKDYAAKIYMEEVTSKYIRGDRVDANMLMADILNPETKVTIDELHGAGILTDIIYTVLCRWNKIITILISSYHKLRTQLNTANRKIKKLEEENEKLLAEVEKLKKSKSRHTTINKNNKVLKEEVERLNQKISELEECGNMANNREIKPRKKTKVTPEIEQYIIELRNRRHSESEIAQGVFNRFGVSLSRVAIGNILNNDGEKVNKGGARHKHIDMNTATSMLNSGHTKKSVADHFGVTVNTLNSRLKSNNIN